MGMLVVAVVLPLLQLVVEQVGVIDRDAVEETAELLGVDAVGSLHLAVQPGRGRPDVGVIDALVEQVPVDSGLELGAVEFLAEVKPGLGFSLVFRRSG